VDVIDLPAAVRPGTPIPPRHTSVTLSPEGLTLAEVEKAHIERVLALCGWNRSAAARALGIDRRTLFSKIQRHGLIGPLRPLADEGGGEGGDEGGLNG
jgi:transcriptional regulator of acetoin/glycerol metabolism